MEYVLHLYIAGSSQHSLQALSQVRDVCESFLHGRFELKVIDVFENPEMAETNNIIAVPTLVRVRPVPSRRVVGDLTDRTVVKIGLDLVDKNVSNDGSTHD